MKIAMINLHIIRTGVKEVATGTTRVFHELAGDADALDLFKRDNLTTLCRQGTVSDDGRCFLWTASDKRMYIGTNIVRQIVTNKSTGETYVLYKGDGITPRVVRDKAMQFLKHGLSYAQALEIADHELNEEANAESTRKFQESMAQQQQEQDSAAIDGLETPTTAPKRGRKKKSA